MAGKLIQPLYLITDGSTLRIEQTLAARIEQALVGADGAIGYVQLREQVGEFPASDSEVLVLAEALKPVCERYNAKLILNSNLALSKSPLFDGVHLGARSETIAAARETLTHDKIIGYSAHSVAEALEALSQGADYIFLGPIFSPLSKQDTRKPLGLEPLRELCLKTEKIVYALGGINRTNIAECLEAGASGVAGITLFLSFEEN